MDTLQLIEINQKQLLATLSSNRLNFSKSVKIDVVFDDVRNLIRKINYDILNDYIKSGPKKDRLDFLKKQSYDLFNILTLFNFDDYFIKLKKYQKPYSIQLVLDSKTNIIPFEILNDGKDFLSDYIIFSRVLVDSKEYSNKNFLIDSNNDFAIVANPSEDDDIKKTIDKEMEAIKGLIDSTFKLKGPYKGRNVSKIELIRVMGGTPLFHFSGHYIQNKEMVGWKLYNDIFNFEDIKKISKAPKFIFANSCGDGSLAFFEFINSFLNKGTKAVISTIGKVPSDKASEFSQIFYKYFIQDGHNVAKSLFLSRSEMIKKYDQSDLFWCFYQIYGSSTIQINKKLNIKIEKAAKKSIIKNIFIASIVTLLSIIIYNNYFNTEDLNELAPKRNVFVKSNIEDQGKVYSFNIGEGFVVKDKEDTYNSISVYSKNKQNNKIDLCPTSDCLSKTVFINSYNDVVSLLEYNNDTLDVFFHNPDEYYEIKIEFDNTDNNELYVNSRKNNNKNFIIEIINNDQQSYKFKLKNLVKLMKLYGNITKADLNSDNLENYRAKEIKIGGISTAGIRIKFNQILIIKIKKALIN